MKQEMQQVFDMNEPKFQMLFGQRIPQRGKRALTFVEQTPTLHLLKRTVAPPFLGMTLGGTVGGMVGLIGGPKGAAVGMGSGAGVGLLAGTAYAGYKTRRAYRNWLRQYRSDEVLPELLQLLHDQPELEEYKCTLTHNLMHYPFIDPWGHSYEKVAIERWVREHGTSPLAKQPMKVSELRPNYGLMGRQAKAYRALLEQETNKLHLTSIQKEGVAALLSDLDTQIIHCFHAENHLLLELLRKGKISRRTYVSHLSLIVDSLDP